MFNILPFPLELCFKIIVGIYDIVVNVFKNLNVCEHINMKRIHDY